MSNKLTEKTKEEKSKKMAELMEQEKDATPIPQVGELVEGIVTHIGKNEIQLDINGVAIGVVRGKEVLDESGDASNLKIGDKVAATVLDLDNENGELELSFRFAGHQKAWENLEDIQKSEEVVMARIIDANKGGLMIKVGNVIGFLPVSQLTTEHYPRVEGGDKNKILSHLKDYAGQEFKVKIIDVNEAEEKLIVSEKAAWEEKQQSAMSKYNVGDKVKGSITGVVDFGAFVEFGEGLEGLIHISELAWQRIDDPRDIIHVGDKVEAEIIAVENTKISLSIKKLKQDPWEDVEKKYKVGQKVMGKVLKVNPFGAFIELDEDIHGLAHISELAEGEVNDPTDILQIGENYEFNIISIEPGNHRLGLSVVKSKKTTKKSVKKKEEKETPEETTTPVKKEKTSKEKPAKIKEKVVEEEKPTEVKEKVVKEEPTEVKEAEIKEKMVKEEKPEETEKEKLIEPEKDSEESTETKSE